MILHEAIENVRNGWNVQRKDGLRLVELSPERPDQALTVGDAVATDWYVTCALGPEKTAYFGPAKNFKALRERLARFNANLLEQIGWKHVSTDEKSVLENVVGAIANMLEETK